MWAWVINLYDPLEYYVRQHPDAAYQNVSLTPQALVLTLQTGNILLLLAGVAIVCCWTTHADIAKRYLFIVAIADIGHIWSVYRGIGHEHFLEVAKWNDMVWGGVGGSMFLHAHRWVTLLGLYGSIGSQVASAKKRK